MADPLRAAALRLRKIQPEIFQQFINDLRDYTQQVLASVADAPTDEVLRMQGRAKQAQVFLRVFEECHLLERPSQDKPAS